MAVRISKARAGSLALLLLLGGMVAARPALAGPTLAVGTGFASGPGLITVPITIAGAAGLTSFQFDLAFDPAAYQVVGLDDTSTDFAAAAAAGGGSLLGLTSFIDNTGGLVGGAADAMVGLLFGSGLAPGGVLADITFQSVGPGSAALSLSNAFLTDAGAVLSSANGDFTLQNGAVLVAEPGALALLVPGLAALGLAARRRRSSPPRNGAPT